MMSNDGFSTFVLHADTYHGSTEAPSWGHGPRARVDSASELKEIISDT